MTLLWICFILFIMYFAGYETWFGLFKYKKITSDIKHGVMPKIGLYFQMMLGLWIPAGFVILLWATGKLTINDLGLGVLKPTNNPWLKYISSALVTLYFLYLVYSLVALRINAIKKVSLTQKIPDEVKFLLPVTQKEKQVWFFTAITAGFTEELLFRGFFFYLMLELFPDINIFIVLAISTLIFGIGHLYQGLLEATKPMLLGLIYGLFFIALGSIIPCIILHMLQDLCAMDMINE